MRVLFLCQLGTVRYNLFTYYTHIIAKWLFLVNLEKIPLFLGVVFLQQTEII
jgi:hypothetical protein